MTAATPAPNGPDRPRRTGRPVGVTPLLYRDFPPVASRPDIACRPGDNNDFVPGDVVLLDSPRAAMNRAQRICRRCPARDECAAWAIATRQPDGVWGGLTPKERRRVIKDITNRAS